MPDDPLADYLRDLADRMHLRDWTVFASSDPEARPEDGVDGSQATFAGTLGRKSASVWIERGYWETGDREEVRQTLVHELIHAHLHQSRETVIHLCHGHKKSTAAVLLDIYDTTSEYAVDALADVLAPFLPLPPAIPSTETGDA